MIICKKCEIKKQEDDFYFRNKKLNKRRSECKVCSEQSRKSKEHYEKYKDEYKIRRIKRQTKLLNENRNSMMSYLNDNPCVDCGENDPIVLEFDHLVRSEKKYTISSMMRDFTWTQILVEIDKCEVRCANCHRRRTAKQLGWYKYTEQSQFESD